MKDTNYAFCVARIRALENKLLSKQDIITLINQKDYSSAVNFLVQNGYIDNPDEDVDLIIKKLNDELHKLLIESVPDKNELNSLYILNDYYNIKVIVKCFVEGVPADKLMITPTNISVPDYGKLPADHEFSFIDKKYRDVAKKAYNIAVKSKNGMISDAIIDNVAITDLSDVYSCKNSGLVGEISAFIADTANIKIALRCIATKQDGQFIEDAIGKCALIDREKLINATLSGKDTLISYLSSTVYNEGVAVYAESPSLFEKWCDDRIISISHKAKYTSFGFSPVVSYYYIKNLEIKTVRIILTALKSGIDKEIIKERMRKVYA